MRQRHGKAILAAFVLASTLSTEAAGGSEEREDHEVARSALMRGEVMAVRDIVDVARAAVGDDLLRVELERAGERWIYEIRYVDEAGRVRKLNLDARSGERLESEDD
ncbi:MAG: hypothetical protein BMS9Abin14_499 [Gammaproteobacteria bacterium]|nr:MAG: hypothetical protein BMS9Abin14_499 [Gammaproteobacteria bacterium]